METWIILGLVAAAAVFLAWSRMRRNKKADDGPANKDIYPMW